MYGLYTRGQGGRPEHAMKPTRFMTNSRAIASELARRCDKTHRHQPLTDGRAKEAAKYPPELCKAICRGMLRHKRERIWKVSAVVEVSLPKTLPDVEQFHDTEEVRAVVGETAWDDGTSMELDKGMVVKARRKEIEYVRDRKVWVKIPRSVARRNGWKIVKTRWIDINKGDDKEPMYRCRIVGKEFNNGEMEGLFAGTPPLEALRYLVSQAATVTEGGLEEEQILMVNDVARAFFEAEATRNICIELPEEDL